MPAKTVVVSGAVSDAVGSPPNERPAPADATFNAPAPVAPETLTLVLPLETVVVCTMLPLAVVALEVSPMDGGAVVMGPVSEPAAGVVSA